MTAQIDDILIWNRSEYIINAIELENGEKLFVPSEFKLSPVMMHTACYRGYYCTFRLLNRELFLSELVVKHKTKRYPIINGIKAKLDMEFGSGRAIYSNLMYPIKVTGVLRLANGFISSRYEHMGFQEITAYRNVQKITFQNGVVADCEDLSENVKALRTAQADINKFKKHNWLNCVWESRLLHAYSYVDDDNIARTFERKLEPVDANQVYEALNQIKIEQAMPFWFLFNFCDYYEQIHQYHFKLSFLRLLGCPYEVLKYLDSLKSSECSEGQVIVAFIETLRSAFADELQDELFDFVMAKQYVKANVPLAVKKRIENFLAGTSLEKWSIPSNII